MAIVNKILPEIVKLLIMKGKHLEVECEIGLAKSYLEVALNEGKSLDEITIASLNEDIRRLGGASEEKMRNVVQQKIGEIQEDIDEVQQRLKEIANKQNKEAIALAKQAEELAGEKKNLVEKEEKLSQKEGQLQAQIQQAC